MKNKIYCDSKIKFFYFNNKSNHSKFTETISSNSFCSKIKHLR